MRKERKYETKKIRMCTNDNMSVCAFAIVLANKGNKEEAAVNAYNGNNPNYAGKIQGFLKDFGIDFVK